MALIEAVAQHPFVFLAIGTWSLILVAIICNALKECIATLATGKRTPPPDWRGLANLNSTPQRSQQRRHYSRKTNGNVDKRTAKSD